MVAEVGVEYSERFGYRVTCPCGLDLWDLTSGQAYDIADLHAECGSS